MEISWECTGCSSEYGYITYITININEWKYTGNIMGYTGVITGFRGTNDMIYPMFRKHDTFMVMVRDWEEWCKIGPSGCV
jgi:hypothetical protein